MIYKSNEEVISLVKGFGRGTLPQDRWTHAAYLTVGLYYRLKYPLAVTKKIMREGVCRLNDNYRASGADTCGYHETLTVFWLLTIEEFAENAKCGSLAETANLLVASCDRELPLRIYSRELLFSPEAKTRYVEPDLRKHWIVPSELAFSASFAH